MWNRPRGYKGLRTNYRHAFRIHIRKLSDVRASHKSIYDQQTIMEEWCEENCKHHWSSNHYSEWWFDNAQEAIMFKMIFGGL